MVACAYVAVSCQLAGPSGYHPPLARSPLFQGKRALLCCTALVMQKARFLLEGGLWFVGYWMVLVRVPMFWMVTVMVSPGWRWPTPAGVPL